MKQWLSALIDRRKAVRAAHRAAAVLERERLALRPLSQECEDASRGYLCDVGDVRYQDLLGRAAIALREVGL